MLHLMLIFGFIIALTAIRGHYRRLDRMDGQFAPADQQALDRALDTARRLEARMEVLERVLDEDAPGWRSRTRS